jgi:predicted amidophosphoribosyltransferase
MQVIKGVALGTYFAKGAEAARDTPNSNAMRGLVYAVKDNREPPNPAQAVQHPLHPLARAIRVNRDNAIEYVTAMLAKRIAKLSKFWGADDPRAVALVPVPSSQVTVSTIHTARFRTLRLCNALAGVGLGTVSILAVQRKPIVSKTQQPQGTRRSVEQVLSGLTRTPVPIPRAQTIVLVDDNVQSGNSLVALDQLLDVARPTCAFAVAVTDSQPCSDALAFRTFSVSYEDKVRPLIARCEIDPIRSRS